MSMSLPLLLEGANRADSVTAPVEGATEPSGGRDRRYRERCGVRDDRRARGRPPGRQIPARPGPLDRPVSLARSGEAALARGRGGRRQDRGGEGPCPGDLFAADSAAVLRRARRRSRRVRVELLKATPAY